MSALSDSYWSIEACGWVSCPARDEVSLPRPAEAPEARVDLTGFADEDLDVASGVPV